MRILLVSALIIIIDQATKIAVKQTMHLYQSISVLGDFFRLTYIENSGMAFGIQLGTPLILSIVSGIATIAIFIYFYVNRHQPLPYRLALALILGGAIGNLIDRFMYGKVVDFLDVGFESLRWYVFNVADSAVTVGMIILFFMMIFEKQETPSEEENEEDNESISGLAMSKDG